ncbi:hypothetical protein RJ55_00077 [Drechmeria coniospora]|nr:hypothetical protein RJ55_00077 [Drechmeria coniospora]
MGGMLLLLALCVVMALASFFAGALPLSMTLTQSQLRLITSIGVGILVGTSLIVIIPEGIEAAAMATSPSHIHNARSLATRAPWKFAMEKRQVHESTTPAIVAAKRDAVSGDALRQLVSNAATPLTAPASVRKREGGRAVDDSEPATTMPRKVAGEGEEDKGEGKKGKEKEKEKEKEGDEEGGVEGDGDGDGDGDAKHEEHFSIPGFEVGFSMVLGFVLMFLIDRIPRHATETFQSSAETTHMSLDNLGSGDGAGDPESVGFLDTLAPTPRSSRSMATTMGLVIHAAADGIAMGASSASSNMRLGFIIFIAIMIHKAPAAFGLTSILLRQGLSKRAARGHLIIFSLAAPAGALLTGMLVRVLGGDHIEGEHGQWWTGMLLLFSGGTFLYVAMHAMQEEGSLQPVNELGPGTNGYTEGPSANGQRKMRGPQMRDTLATVAGMFLPLVTQLGGHHHH